MPGWFRYALFAIFALAGVSLFGLAATSSDSSLFEKYYPFLSVANRVIAVLLFALVVAMIARLAQYFRQHRFGMHMTVRLAAVTAGIAVSACLVIYLVSALFISRSIDSWFDVRVERALDSGVTITRGILQQQQTLTEATARQMAEALSRTPPSQMINDLMRLTEREANLEALVFLGNGTAVAAAGSRLNVLLPELPTPAQMRVVRSTGIYSVIDGDAFENTEALREGRLSIRVIVPIGEVQTENAAGGFGNGGLFDRSGASANIFLQVVQGVADETSRNAADLVTGYRDYQTLVLSRASLRSIYSGTLFLTLLFVAFGAVAFAIAFARRSIDPLLQLEAGTHRAADGNFLPIREFPGSNEINVLTKSFNTMLREVDEARRGLDAQRREAEQAQTYLERVLANISSGVVVIDHEGTIVTANAAAVTILGSDLCGTGLPIAEAAPNLLEAIDRHRQQQTDDEESGLSFEFELVRENRTTPLYVKTSSMPLGALEGTVLVFDDVTNLYEAQRATAWGEVARRLAHEIKNPLTPIRLAAERLEMKLEDHLTNEADQLVLRRAISTITSQVDALKQMVNDFREYAKLPVAQLKPLDLNAFIEDCAQLYHEAGIEILTHLDPNLPMIEADQAQLRQVLHNLISNSIDAAEGGHPEIRVSTKLETGPGERRAVRLVIRDNGCGFTEAILSKAFEPYVTTKETGTGLGLPMVKKILDEHHARITLSNQTDASGMMIYGARIDILFRAAPGEPTDTSDRTPQQSEI